MTPIRAPFERLLSRIEQEIENPTPSDEVLDILKSIGRSAIRQAADTKGTLDDTYNQLEAYAFGVYFNGRVYRQGYLDNGKYRNSHENSEGRDVKGAAKDPKRHKYGRSQALHVIRDHKPGHRGYELYLINAMWYSMIHEEWGIPILRQSIRDAAAKIADELGVDVYINFETYSYSK